MNLESICIWVYMEINKKMIKWVKWIDGKINSKISVQLYVSFIGMFSLIFILSSLLLYFGIVNVLRNNYKDNSIKQFQQNQYNISTFVNQIDLLLTQLVMDDKLDVLYNNEAALNSGEVIQHAQALDLFSVTMANFKFIDSIVYYGANGLSIKASSDQNIVKYDKNGSKDRFYVLESKNILSSNNLQLSWFGGYTNRDFGINPILPIPAVRSDEKYMSAVRIVYGQAEAGILVLNINMDYFTSIYSHNNNSQLENSYMINNSGTIISDGDTIKIGKKSATYCKMDGNKEVQSFTITDGNQIIQAVYYHLGIADWILVDEIPIELIKKNVLYLQTILLGMGIISLILAIIMSRFRILKLTKPLRQLILAMKKMSEGNLGLTIKTKSKNELGILSNQFNIMSLNIQDLIQNKIKVQEEKRIIEMQALRSQINPHFIYNTLNTIRWMAIIQKADSVAESLSTLSDYLSPIFKSNDSVCTLNDEIEFTLNYMKILNYRYMGAYQVYVVIPNEFFSCEVPRFILQPLLENSIEHGFSQKNGGNISISAWEEQNTLRIKVADDGEGLPEEKMNEIVQAMEHEDMTIDSEDKHIGLPNVYRRIKLQYGEPYGLLINSHKGLGTEVTVVLPVILKT